MGPISVLVVDDQPAFRKAASAVIAAIDELELVAEAFDLPSAMHEANQLRSPFLALVDLQLGEDSGIDVCRQLSSERSDVSLILISAAAEADLPSGIDTCGAAAFMAKSRFDPETLTNVLRSIGHLA